MLYNSIDKTGQKFNMLTVIERLPNYKNNGKTYYRCLCECGNIKIIPNDRVGKTYSCGCVSKSGLSNRKDYVGQKFNLLTVKEMLYNYKNNQTYCRCICDCGKETIAFMGNVKSGKTKSCGCQEVQTRYNRKHHEKNLIGQRFGHLTVLKITEKRYENGCVGWLCQCDCGNQVIVRSGNLLIGKTRSCGCNKTSKYEDWVEDILSKLKVTYQKEFKFDECRNHFALPFDFYMEYNGQKFCIECQGQQHYEPIKHFGGQKRFETTQLNDKIKKEYCETNNIILICLPYTLSKDEMQEIILNILNPVTTTVT